MSGHAHDDPTSLLLEPGRSAEIIWSFTTDADLGFAPNVPGHDAAGVTGAIEIEH